MRARITTNTDRARPRRFKLLKSFIAPKIDFLGNWRAWNLRGRAQGLIGFGSCIPTALSAFAARPFRSCNRSVSTQVIPLCIGDHLHTG